jgi:hypothetical protein
MADDHEEAKEYHQEQVFGRSEANPEGEPGTDELHGREHLHEKVRQNNGCAAPRLARPDDAFRERGRETVYRQRQSR